MSTVLMIGYARSGGTLLARCLARLPGVLLFSEVNPCRWPGAGDGRLTLKAQARAWFNIELRSEDYRGGARELAELCAQSDRHLVLRDWPVIDFVPMPENGYKPAGRFSSWDALAALPGARAFGFIRDAIDVWISNGCREDFFSNYRPYLKALMGLGIPIYRYEDFCADPHAVMKQLCSDMGLPFDPAFQTFAGVRHVTGDVDMPSRSRGMLHDRIVKLPRPRISGDRARWVDQNPDARAINALAGYPPAYASCPLENRWLAAAGRLRTRAANWRKTPEIHP